MINFMKEDEKFPVKLVYLLSGSAFMWSTKFVGTRREVTPVYQMLGSVNFCQCQDYGD